MELEGGIGSNHNGRIIVSYVHQNGIVGRHGQILFLKYFYSDMHIGVKSHLVINDHEGKIATKYSVYCLGKWRKLLSYSTLNHDEITSSQELFEDFSGKQ